MPGRDHFDGPADGGQEMGTTGRREFLEAADVLTGNDYLADDVRPTDYEDV